MRRKERNLIRFLDEQDLARGVNQARAHLVQNPEGALFGTLVYDGYLTLEPAP
jgi:hypothetical protein